MLTRAFETAQLPGPERLNVKDEDGEEREVMEDLAQQHLFRRLPPAFDLMPLIWLPSYNGIFYDLDGLVSKHGYLA